MIIVHAGIGLRIARVDAGGVGAGVEVKRRPAHGIAACDPAAGVEQPAACVVHGGAVAQTKSCLTLCNPMDCSTQGLPVLHHLPEFVQIQVC